MQNKKIILDSGPIITIVNANLMNIFSAFKKYYNISFIITPNVKKELIDEPRSIKRFELEALYVEEELNNKNIVIFDANNEVIKMTERIANLANSVILVNNKPLEIVQAGELESIAYAVVNKIDFICVDERNTRLLIEDPLLLSKVIGQRLHKKVTLDKKKSDEIRLITKNLKLVRSSELAIIGVKNNLLSFNTKELKSAIITAILWNFKLHGCTISLNEIEESKKMV